MPTDAQKRANKKQDASRKRVPLWLDEDDVKALDRLKKRRKAISRIALFRDLMKAALEAKNGN